MWDGLQTEELGLQEAAREMMPEWPRLRVRADLAPFLSPDYLALWGRAIGRLGECRTIVARRLGELVGFGPFVVREAPIGPFVVPCLGFVGNNVGYPGDVLYSDVAAAPPQGPVVRAILEHASRWRVNAWDLGYVAPSSVTNALAPAILGGPTSDLPREPQPYAGVSLPPTWDGFLETRSGNARRNFRRRVERLSEFGEVRVRTARTPVAVRRRVLELIRNHEKWSKGTEREAWLGGEPVERFHVEGAGLLAARGEFLAFALELDGTPIAWNIGAFDGGRYFEHVISYDRTYREYAPGVLLGMFAARELIGLHARRYELGPGLDERKQGLGGDAVLYPHLRGYHGWLRALAVIRGTLRRGSVPT